MLFRSTSNFSFFNLSWLAPGSNGGQPITDYVIQYRASVDGSWNTINDGVGSNTAYTFNDIYRGHVYYFRVAAKNIVGTGPYSAVFGIRGADVSNPTPSVATIITSFSLLNNCSSGVFPVDVGPVLAGETVRFDLTGQICWSSGSTNCWDAYGKFGEQACNSVLPRIPRYALAYRIALTAFDNDTPWQYLGGGRPTVQIPYDGILELTMANFQNGSTGEINVKYTIEY